LAQSLANNRMIPALNGEPGGAIGLGYMPEVPPPRPTKPPPRVEPPQPIIVQTNGIQEKALANIVNMLERNMDRMEKEEKERKKAMSESFKKNVQLSSDIYGITKTTIDRTNRVSKLEKNLDKLLKEAGRGGGMSAVQRAQIKTMSEPLFGDSTVRSYKNEPAKSVAVSGENGVNSLTYLEEISRKIDEITAGGKVVNKKGHEISNKGMKNLQEEVERLKAERVALLSSKSAAETNLEQLQMQVGVGVGREREREGKRRAWT
jgi:hypothetical protein